MATDTEKATGSLATQLAEVPKNMRIFSLCMRTLYSTEAIGSQEREAQRFRKLRDDTRNDAGVYLNCILPVTTSCISNIGDYFEYYEALTFDEWGNNLDEIINEAEKHKQACNVLKEIHKRFLIPLKKRQDEAGVLLREIVHLDREFFFKAEKLKNSAETKRKWAFWLFFIPFVGAIAAPILGVSSYMDLVNQIEVLNNREINMVATKVVEESLIPALNAFILGLDEIAGFFETIQQVLLSFKGKCENVKDQKYDKNPKFLHYKTMKLKATEIKNSCYGFFAVLPAVGTDFEAITTDGADQNYVDKWREKQNDIVKQNCDAKGLCAGFLIAITGKKASR